MTAAAALGVAVTMLGGDAAAVSTRVWTTSSYKEFDEGEPSGAAITSLGEVVPGAATRRVDLHTDAVWTAVRAPDGTIYAGSVTDGKIFVVSGGKSRVLATLEEDTPWIGALTLGPNGTLYAGTVGSGTVFAVDPRNGKVTKLVTLEGADHVWSLAFDAAGKTLYAGSGPDGKLFAISPARKSARVVWEADDKHLLSMMRARDGALWIGTSEEAILYRFDPATGEGRAIADFAGSEVKAIAEVQGAVMVAANEFAPSTSSTVPAPPAAKGPKGTTVKPPATGPGAAKPKPGAKMPARPGERKGKGALFRVEPDGRSEQIHALADSYYQSLAATDEGAVYASAGAQGRVYLVRPDRSVMTVFDVEERQVNALLWSKEGLAFATGDGGAVFLTDGASREARYTSKVHDAQFAARWGDLVWRGDGDLVIETRSGNTAKPGRGWSDWKRPQAAVRVAGRAVGGRVASPPGRYLQYRVSFGAKPAALREVKVYYLPQNQRARVTEINVGDGGDPNKKAWVTLAEGAAKPRSPVVKLKWKVENPDDDALAYRVECRREGDPEWQAVPTGSEPLTKPELDWNTEMLPDGYYRLRITASDERANPGELALDDLYLTQPFLVDNQKPQVTALAVRMPWASGVALDSFSRIDEIAWSVDGGEWHMAFPRDGIFDQLSEAFSVKMPADLKPGAHVLSVRVADEGDNVGAATVTFRVGK